MIIGIHTLIFSNDVAADRAFLRDVLGLPHVDSGDGWLIFKAPPSELAVHPAEGKPEHQLYLMSDDIAQTMGEFKSKGIEATVRMPGGGALGIYEPRHATALDL